MATPGSFVLSDVTMSNTSDAFIDDSTADDGVKGFSPSDWLTDGVLRAEEEAPDTVRRFDGRAGLLSGVEKLASVTGRLRPLTSFDSGDVCVLDRHTFFEALDVAVELTAFSISSSFPSVSLSLSLETLLRPLDAARRSVVLQLDSHSFAQPIPYQFSQEKRVRWVQ